MGKGKTLSSYERGLIDGYIADGLSFREIAERIKRSDKVIRNYAHLKENYAHLKENYAQKTSPGRPQVLTPKDKRRILKEANNKIISTAKIKHNLELNCSRQTVWRVVNGCEHLQRKKKRSRPALKDRHKSARLQWAKEHMNWTKEWDQVIFSDEKKFNLDGPDGYQYYWHDLRKDQEIYSKRVHGGGGLMIWAAFGRNGKTNLAFITQRINSIMYQQVLSTHLLSFG